MVPFSSFGSCGENDELTSFLFLTLKTIKLDTVQDSDKKSLENARRLFSTGTIRQFEVGNFKSLRQIHLFLFKDFYSDAGRLRQTNLSEGSFRYLSPIYLEAALAKIEKLPQSNLQEILSKYIEMNLAHPFMQRSGWTTRIWLNMLLQQQLGKVIDWTKVDKTSYRQAMDRSLINQLELNVLLQNALSDDIDNLAMILNGLESSYSFDET